MHYDLTLDNLKIPNITGTFPFGTKVTPSDINKGGLSTTEVNTNMMMPFANMRPKVVDQDGDTTTVEYDAKLVFSARSGTTPSAGYSVVMGQGAYVGCTVTFTNLMSYSCKVYQYDGTTTLFDIPSGNTLQAVWNGSVWVWTTSNAIIAHDPRPVSSAAVHAAILPSMITAQIPFEPASGITITSNGARLVKISNYLYQFLCEPLEFTATATGGYQQIGTFPKSLVSGKSVLITAENCLYDNSLKAIDCYITDTSTSSMGMIIRNTIEAGSHSLCGSILIILKD